MKTLYEKLKILLTGALSLFLIFVIALCFYARDRDHQIIIGAKNCTEQHILAEIVSQLIEAKTDLKVVRRFNLEGTTISFSALKSGTIDLYFEYTGTALLDILKEPLTNQEIYPYVKKVFAEKYGIVWLDRLGFTNQYGLIIRSEEKLENFSELTSDHIFAIDPEFASREEFALLKTTYPHLAEKSPKLMDQVLLYFSLLNKNVDVISGFSTDGRLIDQDLILLTDDQKCFPLYEVAPLITEKCLQKYPEILPILELLKGKITNEEMCQFNHQVEFEGKKIQTIAQEFLF